MLINREQQRVIDEVEQNILLLASAGTGKTNTLAYRVAHLIEGGYECCDWWVNLLGMRSYT